MLRLSRNLRFEVHKALRLPRNLRSEVHKVLRLQRNLRFQFTNYLLPLLRNLHFKAHKALRLPRNLYFEVHKVLCLPRNLHTKCCACPRNLQTSHMSKSHDSLQLSRSQNASKITTWPKCCACHDLHFEVSRSDPLRFGPPKHDVSDACKGEKNSQRHSWQHFRCQVIDTKESRSKSKQ